MPLLINMGHAEAQDNRNPENVKKKMMKRNMEHERINMGGLKAKLDAITQELKKGNSFYVKISTYLFLPKIHDILEQGFIQAILMSIIWHKKLNLAIKF